MNMWYHTNVTPRVVKPIILSIISSGYTIGPGLSWCIFKATHLEHARSSSLYLAEAPEKRMSSRPLLSVPNDFKNSVAPDE